MIITEQYWLMQGDCLDLMRSIPDKSVDMILCDLPYGILKRNKATSRWDSALPFDKLWEQYDRIIKDNRAIILFGQGMFTAQLMMSNPKLWRYNLVWKKGNFVTGFLNANKQPLRNHEDILVFSKGGAVYNPQMTVSENSHNRGGCGGTFVYDVPKKMAITKTNEYYPTSILDFEKDSKKLHPTQKPVALLEYLIKTYSNEGDIVLDNCVGSGSTGVACLHTGRKFIGIELDEKYFDIAKTRLESE